jgi:hypothetical protein
VIFFDASEGSLSGVSAFLAANLATHLYHHARKPCSSGYSELPEYVNHVVDELLDWPLPDSEPTPLRDNYIKDISSAIVATRPSTAKQLLTKRPRLKYRWMAPDETELWDHVEDQKMISAEYAAAAAAVGILQALELYFAFGCPLLDQPSLMFGNLFAAAASTGKDATLKYLLKRLDKHFIDSLDAPR